MAKSPGISGTHFINLKRLGKPWSSPMVLSVLPLNLVFIVSIFENKDNSSIDLYSVKCLPALISRRK